MRAMINDVTKRPFGPALLLPFLLAASLSGCAGRPQGVLIPTAAAATAKGAQVDMLVATTRLPSESPGILFSGERSDELRITDIAISIPPDSEDRKSTRLNSSH